MAGLGIRHHRWIVHIYIYLSIIVNVERGSSGLRMIFSVDLFLSVHFFINIIIIRWRYLHEWMWKSHNKMLFMNDWMFFAFATSNRYSNRILEILQTFRLTTLHTILTYDKCRWNLTPNKQNTIILNEVYKHRSVSTKFQIYTLAWNHKKKKK